jgi:hypothetical protein
MEIVTIACPPGFTDENIVETAPIWTDGTTDYQVASGPLEGYITSDPIEARPDRVNVLAGMDGLAALAAMGLTLKQSIDML